MHAQFVREVVMNLSSPLVFSTFGSMGVMAGLATEPPSAGWQLASALIAAIMTNILALGCLRSSNLLVFFIETTCHMFCMEYRLMVQGRRKQFLIMPRPVADDGHDFWRD